jgi:histone-lysine N-methyltransferase SETMAR
VAQFKPGNFPTCYAPRPGQHKAVTNPEFTDQIHELILEDRRISAKSISEQLGISRERIESVIHEDLDMRKLCAKWVPKCLNMGQKLQRCQSFEQILEFFCAIQIVSCRVRLVTMDETWLHNYDPETNNSQWSGGITAQPAPKISEFKKPLENVLP